MQKALQCNALHTATSSGQLLNLPLHPPSVLQGMQKALLSAIVASMLVNMGTVLRLSALSGASTASFVGAGICGLFTLINVLKVRVVPF